MADIRKVTPQFSVAPQIEAADVEVAKAQGFVKLINNRPDGEVPGQPANAEIERAARRFRLARDRLGLFGRRPAGEGDVHIAEPCRAGTRSITAWSLGQAQAGHRSRQELMELAAGAGYDLSAALGA